METKHKTREDNQMLILKDTCNDILDKLDVLRSLQGEFGCKTLDNIIQNLDAKLAFFIQLIERRKKICEHGNKEESII